MQGSEMTMGFGAASGGKRGPIADGLDAMYVDPAMCCGGATSVRYGLGDALFGGATWAAGPFPATGLAGYPMPPAGCGGDWAPSHAAASASPCYTPGIFGATAPFPTPSHYDAFLGGVDWAQRRAEGMSQAQPAGPGPPMGADLGAKGVGPAPSASAFFSPKGLVGLGSPLWPCDEPARLVRGAAEGGRDGGPQRGGLRASFEQPRQPRNATPPGLREGGGAGAGRRAVGSQQASGGGCKGGRGARGGRGRNHAAAGSRELSGPDGDAEPDAAGWTLGGSGPPGGRPSARARWHPSAALVGDLSGDDHIFSKRAGPRQHRAKGSGPGYELATICMVFDASLRCGGMHTYNFTVVDGDLGAADGAGFTFDSKVRRRPLWQVHAIFMNQRGYICLRRGQDVSRLPVQLPKLGVGSRMNLTVDLARAIARFEVGRESEGVEGAAEIPFSTLFDDAPMSGQVRSGFFCAVVTGSATVKLD